MVRVKGQIYVPNKDNPVSEEDYDLILPQTTIEQVEGLPAKLEAKADLVELKTKADLVNGEIPEAQLPKATITIPGVVKTGSNITNDEGTISVTRENVKEALGITPIAIDSNIAVTKSTQAAVNPSVTGMPSNYGITVPNVVSGIAAGTYKIQALLQKLVDMSHAHEAVYRNGSNCVCNCQCSD